MMRIYKYQIENELKNLNKIDTREFRSYIDKITSKNNKIVRFQENKEFRYYCTHCHKWHEDKKVNVKSLKKCPHCGRKYSIITQRNVIPKIQYYITYLETNERNELIIRLFYFCKVYDKKSMTFNYDYFEVERINFDRNVYMKMNTSCNMRYITHFRMNKEPTADKGRYSYYYNINHYADVYPYDFIITKNIKSVLKNTKYKYSCLDIISRKHIDIFDYLKSYKIHKELELFVKNGNFRLIKDIIKNRTYPYELENKKSIKYLKYDINLIELKNAIYFDLNKLEDIKAYGYIDMMNNYKYIEMYNLKERKISHYLYRKKQKIDYYKDYLKTAKKIGMDLEDTRVLYPKNLVKSHDDVMKQYEERESEIIDCEIADYAKELEKFNYKKNRLSIFPVHSQSELINESEVLKHCVRRYAKNVSKRETSIFFIRKINHLDEPYVTLELKDNEVIQCRGYGNNIKEPLDDKVKKFVNDWCEKFNFKSCFS